MSRNRSQAILRGHMRARIRERARRWTISKPRTGALLEQRQRVRIRSN